MPSGSYWLVLADSGMAGFGKSNVQADDSGSLNCTPLRDRGWLERERESSP